jgi:hypothetical protein
MNKWEIFKWKEKIKPIQIEIVHTDDVNDVIEIIKTLRKSKKYEYWNINYRNLDGVKILCRKERF